MSLNLQPDSDYEPESETKIDFSVPFSVGDTVTGMVLSQIKGGMLVDIAGVIGFLPGSHVAIGFIENFALYIGKRMDFRILEIDKIRRDVVVSHRVLQIEAREREKEIREKERDQAFLRFTVGEIATGTVATIFPYGVLLDLGGICGLITLKELSNKPAKHPSELVSVGDVLEAKVIKMDNVHNHIRLSVKKVSEDCKWNKMIDHPYQSGTRLTGVITRVLKYGCIVEFESGISGLVHKSEFSWTHKLKHPKDKFVEGETIDVVVIGLEKEKRKLTLSIRQLVEDPRDRIQSDFPPGSRHQGTVSGMAAFGVFVELKPEIEGLIHLSELSWRYKIRHPREIFAEGQLVEVMVIGLDQKKHSLQLSLKQLEEDPWGQFELEYVPESTTEGTISRIVEKGIIVLLPLDVEGFVPNSLLEKSLGLDSKSQFMPGDRLDLIVAEFDKTKHRIILSPADPNRQ